MAKYNIVPALVGSNEKAHGASIDSSCIFGEGGILIVSDLLHQKYNMKVPLNAPEFQDYVQV